MVAGHEFACLHDSSGRSVNGIKSDCVARNCGFGTCNNGGYFGGTYILGFDSSLLTSFNWSLTKCWRTDIIKQRRTGKRTMQQFVLQLRFCSWKWRALLVRVCVYIHIIFKLCFRLQYSNVRSHTDKKAMCFQSIYSIYDLLAIMRIYFLLKIAKPIRHMCFLLPH